ncbi:helix-turn-helix domain-containing protein [Streptomyces sp. NPDC058653]|uniref:helix-turn-helix domain-containing protein n=1 Tax=Streptomyces sp. NPDC058653 TaxID=3346576 RepID=UPI003661A020
MSELGEFIAARRAQLKPADLSLPDFGERRRVPGLRREEVAQLAGISVAYLIRLEQGTSKASPQVVDALAGALQLSDAERSHLHTLVQAGPRARKSRLPADRVTAEVRQLLDAFGSSAPVILLGRRSHVLAWNPAGHALIAGHLDRAAPERAETRPNTVRMLFTDPHTRDLYGADWRHKARDVVGRLRLLAGKYPDDPQLAALIGELSMNSKAFAGLWAEHRVRAWDVAGYRMTHPLVGELRVMQHSIAVPQDPGLRLVVVTAERDSASEAALRLLPHTNDHVRPLSTDIALPR